MDINEILSLNGKIIYVVEKCDEYDITQDNIKIKTTYCIGKYDIVEIRFPSNNNFYEKGASIVFIYNMEYEDCYDYFTLNDIGKTIFFTEEEAKNRMNILKEAKYVSL